MEEEDTASAIAAAAATSTNSNTNPSLLLPLLLLLVEAVVVMAEVVVAPADEVVDKDEVAVADEEDVRRERGTTATTFSSTLSIRCARLASRPGKQSPPRTWWMPRKTHLATQKISAIIGSKAVQQLQKAYGTNGGTQRPNSSLHSNST